MGMSCGCDDDGPEWVRDSNPKARKNHVCVECREEIPTGAIYQYVVGKWEGDVLTFHTCERCAGLRDSYSEMGYCVSFGTLWYDHRDQLHGMGAASDSRAVQLADAVIKHIGSWHDARRAERETVKA